MTRYPGVVIGIVKSLDDPDGEGRIQVEFPWLEEGKRSAWASIATLMAGGKRGAFFMPELEDEALIAFEHGNFDHPFVVGFLWNGVDRPPTDDRHLRLFYSVNGHMIAIYDPPVSGGDQGYIQIQDAQGNLVKLANAQITIRSVGTINIEAPNIIINGRPVLPQSRPI